MSGLLRVATYNIHQCVGRDGACDPVRIAKVLRELRADIIALQEVGACPGAQPGFFQLDYLAASSGLHPVAGPTMPLSGGDWYGNALLVRPDLLDIDYLDLSMPGREPRGALIAGLRLPAGPRLDVVALHLGLQRRERYFQVARLLDYLPREPRNPLLLMGDFNEWWRHGSLKSLQQRFGRPRTPWTFPAWWPVFALDHIWVWPLEHLAGVFRVHGSPLARVASDHLPLLAELYGK